MRFRHDVQRVEAQNGDDKSTKFLVRTVLTENGGDYSQAAESKYELENIDLKLGQVE